MTDKPIPSHEDAERVFEKAGGDFLDKLPDTTETRSARRNLDVVVKYVHEVIDKTRHAPAD